MLKLILGGATHRGKHRDYNEDAFVCLDEHRAAIVSDGMGGLSRGDEASREVIKAYQEALVSGGDAAGALRAANERIVEMSTAQGGRMGATAVCLQFDGASIEISWVGDSRAYLWRDDQLKQLTRDHSFVQELLDAGALSRADAAVHPNRNAVTRAIGVRDTGDLQVDSLSLSPCADDIILLCSDGLSGFLKEDRIAELMDNQATPSKLAEALIQATNTETEAGDNVTVVVARVQD